MAKKKNDGSNPDDEWFNKIYAELKSLVFDGKYPEIDAWFEDHVVGDEGLASKLAQKMHEDLYLFTFQTNLTKREDVEREILKRELAVLKNFKIGLQLMLLDRPIETVKHEHIAALNVTPETKHLLKSNQITGAVTKLLTNEDFPELDKIQDLMDFNIFENKSTTAFFCYKEDYSRGVTYIRMKEKIFSPKFDLVFNFSETKRKYLIDKNVILPTEEEVNALANKMLTSMDDYLQHLHWGKIELAFNNYKVQNIYHDLNEKIGNTTTGSKKNKI